MKSRISMRWVAWPIIVAVAAMLALLTSSGRVSTQLADSHYDCYLAPGIDPPDVVTLETQFGVEESVEVGLAERLCLPAVKTMPDGSSYGTLDITHLRAFLIDEPPPNRVVNITTQFGVFENVELGNARYLLSPTSKQVVEPPGGSYPSTPEPHYKCYQASAQNSVSGLILQDQFNLQGMSTYAGALEYLCLPAGKNGAPIPDAPHLACFDTTLFLDAPTPYIVNLETQFGPEQGVPITPGPQPGYLCVPAEKELALPENPSFSIERPGPSAQPLGPIDAADIMTYSPYGPAVPCLALGLMACHGGDDIDALSIRGDFDQPPPDGLHWLAFSVANGSKGAATTAVNGEFMCIGSTGAEPEADEFQSKGFGDNQQVFDGNGLACDGNAGATMFLAEPAGDDLDALDDDTPLTAPPPVYFSLDPTSPSLAPGGSPADIFVSFAAGAYAVYASSGALGLAATDDIDALCIVDGGDESYFDDGDVVYFSLAKGSPSLAAHGWSAADVLTASLGAPGPAVYMPAAKLGLNPALDDLDALKCYVPPMWTDNDEDTLIDQWEAQQSCVPLGAPPADWDADTLTDFAEFNTYLTDPCVVDTDTDGCSDSEEVGPTKALGGLRNPLNYYDFYDITNIGGVLGAKDMGISGFDLNLILSWLGASAGGGPNANGMDYDVDGNLPLGPPQPNGIRDGVELDFAGISGSATGPDGGISGFDLNQMLSEIGDSCTAPP